MPYTSFNTIDDDDTLTLQNFALILAEAAREVAGGRVINSELEREKWEECARLLADELKSAAKRTDAISSVPAFFAAHLRRRFAGRTKSQSRTEKELQAEVKDPTKTYPAVDPGEKGGGSRYTLEECRRYAEHLQKTGQGITSPGGYATTIYRTGEADTLIEKFLNPQRSEIRDLTKCPDCKGTGFVYPEGIERGVVARCKHSRLDYAIRVFEQIERMRQTHSADAGYEERHLMDDLRFWCEREGIDRPEELIDFLLNI